jgi:hypothetical protein
MVRTGHAGSDGELVDLGDAALGAATVRSSHRLTTKEAGMYVVAYHQIKDPQQAFARGERLIKNEGAPAGVRGLQFYPSRDGSAVTCLWEAPSVEVVRAYVDSTLGDASDNTCWEVAAEQAFAERPLGIQSPEAVRA